MAAVDVSENLNNFLAACESFGIPDGKLPTIGGERAACALVFYPLSLFPVTDLR